MTKQFSLPLVITGRLAVCKGKTSVPVLNPDEVSRFYADKSPADFDSKLSKYAWEVVVGKSGENFKTRYFLADDSKTEVDGKYVKTCGEYRYSIKNPKKDEALNTPEVKAMLAERGRSHANKANRKFTKIMKQMISMLNDKSRPLTAEQRTTMLRTHDALYAKYRQALTETKIATDNTIPDLF